MKADVKTFFKRFALLATLFTFGCALAAEDDGEVHFKPKKFVPRAPATGREYSGRSYSSRASEEIGKTYQTPAAGSWKSYSDTPKADAPAFTSEAGKAPDEKFVQREKISVRTIKVAPNQVEEHKPFIKGDIPRTDKKYTPPEKTNEKNPILAPRQGIKEEHLNEK